MHPATEAQRPGGELSKLTCSHVLTCTHMLIAHTCSHVDLHIMHSHIHVFTDVPSEFAQVCDHARTYTHTHSLVLYNCSDVNACIYTSTYVLTHIYTYTSAHACALHTCPHMCSHIYILAPLLTHALVYMHQHTCALTHTHSAHADPHGFR